MADHPERAAADFAAQLQGDLAVLDRELAEIELLIGQARAEAGRHEQKRVNAAEKLAAPGQRADPAEVAEAYAQLVTLTRRAVLMEAQVEVLEGKHRALARHRAAVAGIVERLAGLPAGALQAAVPGGAVVPVLPAGGPEAGREQGESLSPSLSRVVLSAQEDLRRDIARAMHDGPAQSLTNIVLQAQIVERLMERDPVRARTEVHLLVSMVQATLDATKNFIFAVRPMVLDDLGLVPTLRRSTRDRGRRAHVPVEFESMGQDRRLPMDVESAAFRILDEALAAFLAQAPERVILQLDWTDQLEARLSAHRTPTPPSGESLPDVPVGDVPDAIKQMIQDRHDKRDAAVAAAEEAAIVALPAATRRDAVARASSIGGKVEFLADSGELRLLIPLPPPDGEDGASA